MKTGTLGKIRNVVKRRFRSYAGKKRSSKDISYLKVAPIHTVGKIGSRSDPTGELGAYLADESAPSAWDRVFMTTLDHYRGSPVGDVLQEIYEKGSTPNACGMRLYISIATVYLRLKEAHEYAAIIAASRGLLTSDLEG